MKILIKLCSDAYIVMQQFIVACRLKLIIQSISVVHLTCEIAYLVQLYNHVVKQFIFSSRTIVLKIYITYIHRDKTSF